MRLFPWQQSKADCACLLEFCLFMFSEEGDIQFSSIPKQIETSLHNLTNFNERVMSQLIRNHYFYNNYLEVDVSQSNVYLQLMTYFLMEYPSFELKKAVCLHLIDKLKRRPDEQYLPNHVGLVLNELVAPLIHSYSKSPDTDVQLYACIAL